MFTLPRHRRIALLTEGRLGIFTAKTAASLLRYRAADIVGVIDSRFAGANVRSIVPWAPPVPVVRDLEALAALEPDAIYIGVAPVGGELPASMRSCVAQGLRHGLDVVSGLHSFLADDAELGQLSRMSGAGIYDVRRPPATRRVATAAARELRGCRVLTVGTDANVGKMTATLELHAASQRRGVPSRFVATGQTGIMIAGSGVCVDAVVSDFAAGAVEEALLAAGEADLLLVEGQGSLGHPGFSGVTLSLLHAVCPDVLVLVHHAGRTHHRAEPAHPLPPLDALVEMYERVAGLLHPATVAAVALNTAEADATTVSAEIDRIRRVRDVPVADVLRDGADELLDVILAAPLRRTARSG